MSDACFPRLHVRPAKGWINDPNGVCRVDGRWHVFFQYNPHSPRHHRVGWGHWSSPDLVAWTEHEPALMPTPNGLDAFGCWSGSFVMDGATPTMIYTAVADHARDAVGLVATGSASGSPSESSASGSRTVSSRLTSESDSASHAATGRTEGIAARTP